MRILLTNDDGWDAPGLAALVEVARAYGDIVTVAPDRHLSGCSHQTTTDQALRLVKVAEGSYHLTGTPADCVRIAINGLDQRFDLVLSGVNDGGNMGVDVFMSGTVAAAREAALMGIPAIAVSQYRQSGQGIDWERTRNWARLAIDSVIDEATQSRAGEFWNINLPDPNNGDSPKIVRCPLEPCPLDVEFMSEEIREGEVQFKFTGKYQRRGRTTGSDVDVCFGGDTSVTCVALSEP
jgi:5'-nucleotidase